MAGTDRTVWMVEDSETDARQYKRLLERTGKLHIQYIPVRPGISDYNDLASHPETGAVIIDQYLSERSGVPYDGIDVAEHLRTLREELPIFILTQYYAEDLEDKAQAVDSIIKKEDIRKRLDVYVDRILRAMGRYEETLTTKQRRIKELIDQKISQGLTNNEEEELARLRSGVERPFDLILADQDVMLDAKLQKQEESLAKLQDVFRDLLNELKKDNT